MACSGVLLRVNLLYLETWGHLLLIITKITRANWQFYGSRSAQIYTSYKSKHSSLFTEYGLIDHVDPQFTFAIF